MTVRRREGNGASVALPITPMLDMSFQLLFFFIATFHLPTGMEGQMALAVHEEKVGGGPTTAAPDSPDMVLHEDVTIVLRGDAVGGAADGVSGLKLLSNSGNTTVPYSKDLKELRESLGEMAAKGVSAPTIKLQGDSRVKWRGVVKVMDACREAGFQDITFAQPGDDGPR